MDKYISATELSKRWRCSKSKITRFRKAGVIPYFKPFGQRKVLFLLEDVERYELQNTITTGIEVGAVLPTFTEWGHLL